MFIFLNNFKLKIKFLNQSSTNQYNWGTTELISWTTPKGYQSKGILYKPEDFDPNKKYPNDCIFLRKNFQTD